MITVTYEVTLDGSEQQFVKHFASAESRSAWEGLASCNSNRELRAVSVTETGTLAALRESLAKPVARDWWGVGLRQMDDTTGVYDEATAGAALAAKAKTAAYKAERNRLWDDNLCQEIFTKVDGFPWVNQVALDRLTMCESIAAGCVTAVPAERADPLTRQQLDEALAQCEVYKSEVAFLRAKIEKLEEIASRSTRAVIKTKRPIY